MHSALAVVMATALLAAGSASVIELRDSSPRDACFMELAEALVWPLAPGPEPGVSPVCRQQSQLYLQALGQRQPWDIHISGTPATLRRRESQNRGFLEQCVVTRTPTAENSSEQVRGKPFTASVSIWLNASRSAQPSDAPGLADLLVSARSQTAAGRNVTLTWSSCIPSSCSARDVELALSARLAGLGATGKDKAFVLVDEDADETWQEKPLDVGLICFVALFVCIIVAIVASTIYDKDDVIAEKVTRSPRWHKLLVAFSLRRYSRMLTARSENTIRCLDGLRTLSIIYILLYHVTASNTNIREMITWWPNMVLTSAHVAVDTFFLMSGLLGAMSFLSTHQSGTFNLLSFYWHRYIRLTPLYYVVVWIYASVLPHLGSGPMWDSWLLVNSDNCSAKWWINLLYVNNYVSLYGTALEMCFDNSWYLAADMQLFVLSPLLLLPLARRPRLGRLLLGIVIVTSVLVPFAITLHKRLPISSLHENRHSAIDDFAREMYGPCYTRASPYLVGIALAVALRAHCQRPVRLSKPLLAAGWVVSATACLAVLFGAFPFHLHPYSALESALYAGLHHLVWGVGVAWVIFACETGHGGPVNWFLSWAGFAPLAKLSYGVYLLHVAVVLMSNAQRRSLGYLTTTYHVVHETFAVGTICFIASAFLGLAVEMPFLTLVSVLVPRGATHLS